jgi:hypothetical protein
MDWACSMHGGKKGNAYGVLIGKLEGKQPLGIRRQRCEDNINVDFKEIWYES